MLDFHAALMAQPDDRLVFGEPGRDDDVAAYFHTGGTTGTPKLVAHTHRSQLVAALGGAVLGDMRAERHAHRQRCRCSTSAARSSARLSVFMAGIEPAVMSPGGLRNPAMVQRLLAPGRRSTAPRSSARVPTSVGAVLEVPLDGADLGAVRAGFCGAASLPPAVGERFRQVTGKNLYEVYGMTEASGLIAIDPVAGRRRRRLGRLGAALHRRCVVRRLEADGQPRRRLRAERDRRDHGARAARLAGLPQPGARRRRVRRDGVLNSGDLGYIDAERPHPHRRPLQGSDHPQRPQHRPADDRERDGRAPGGRARRRGRACPTPTPASCRSATSRCAPAPASPRTSCTSTRSGPSPSARRGRSRSTSSTRSRSPRSARSTSRSCAATPRRGWSRASSTSSSRWPTPQVAGAARAAGAACASASTLPEASRLSAAAVEEALASYLFEVGVSIA